MHLDGTPLRPCLPAAARILLREGQAEAVRTRPLAIKLLRDFCQRGFRADYRS
ncbi:MAG: RRXRR domain-containing protein [Deltaproteobacteria bacterium]|nr:RRXRR domain-containing protein [Deltaproteobacteria bacterium]